MTRNANAAGDAASTGSGTDIARSAGLISGGQNRPCYGSHRARGMLADSQAIETAGGPAKPRGLRMATLIWNR